MNNNMYRGILTLLALLAILIGVLLIAFPIESAECFDCGGYCSGLLDCQVTCHCNEDIGFCVPN